MFMDMARFLKIILRERLTELPQKSFIVCNFFVTTLECVVFLLPKL